jgi:hypothetical protein
MHKTNTKINKAAIIIIYHHGINFVTFTKGKNKVVTLFMMKNKRLTHMLKIKVKLKILRIHRHTQAEN